MHGYFGYAVDFARPCRSFVIRSLATSFYLSLGCPLYLGRLFLASSLLCEGEIQIPASHYFLVIIALFASFCYTQELKQLGRALIGPNPGKRTGEWGLK
jgi:hypothetical protein